VELEGDRHIAAVRGHVPEEADGIGAASGEGSRDGLKNQSQVELITPHVAVDFASDEGSAAGVEEFEVADTLVNAEPIYLSLGRTNELHAHFITAGRALNRLESESHSRERVILG